MIVAPNAVGFEFAGEVGDAADGLERRAGLPGGQQAVQTAGGRLAVLAGGTDPEQDKFLQLLLGLVVLGDVGGVDHFECSM